MSGFEDNRTKELTAYLVKAIVDNPEDVSVGYGERRGEPVLAVHVSERDRGTVIGRQGRRLRDRNHPRCGLGWPRDTLARYFYRRIMWVALGRFGRPHGVRGEIRFWPFNAGTELVAGTKTIRVGRKANDATEYSVERVRLDAKGALIRLVGMADRDEVRTLTNQFWFERRDAFPELDDDEVYFVDLIGLAVLNENGEEIGRVKDVLDVGPAEILVISRGGREVMIPNVEAFVLRMDLDAGEIIVRPIDGLLDG